ncbi:hypothetical protein HOG98_04750 [bacterium]|jgi:hypothetical protein|nr:hypothetical protein [bacterium]
MKFKVIAGLNSMLIASPNKWGRPSILSFENSIVTPASSMSQFSAGTNASSKWNDFFDSKNLILKPSFVRNRIIKSLSNNIIRRNEGLNYDCEVDLKTNLNRCIDAHISLSKPAPKLFKLLDLMQSFVDSEFQNEAKAKENAKNDSQFSMSKFFLRKSKPTRFSTSLVGETPKSEFLSLLSDQSVNPLLKQAVVSFVLKSIYQTELSLPNIVPFNIDDIKRNADFENTLKIFENSPIELEDLGSHAHSIFCSLRSYSLRSLVVKGSALDTIRIQFSNLAPEKRVVSQSILAVLSLPGAVGLNVVLPCLKKSGASFDRLGNESNRKILSMIVNQIQNKKGNSTLVDFVQNGMKASIECFHHEVPNRPAGLDVFRDANGYGVPFEVTVDARESGSDCGSELLVGESRGRIESDSEDESSEHSGVDDVKPILIRFSEITEGDIENASPQGLFDMLLAALVDIPMDCMTILKQSVTSGGNLEKQDRLVSKYNTEQFRQGKVEDLSLLTESKLTENSCLRGNNDIKLLIDLMSTVSKAFACGFGYGEEESLDFNLHEANKVMKLFLVDLMEASLFREFKLKLISDQQSAEDLGLDQYSTHNSRYITSISRFISVLGNTAIDENSLSLSKQAVKFINELTIDVGSNVSIERRKSVFKALDLSDIKNCCPEKLVLFIKGNIRELFSIENLNDEDSTTSSEGIPFVIESEVSSSCSQNSLDRLNAIWDCLEGSIDFRSNYFEFISSMDLNELKDLPAPIRKRIYSDMVKNIWTNNDGETRRKVASVPIDLRRMEVLLTNCDMSFFGESILDKLSDIHDVQYFDDEKLGSEQLSCNSEDLRLFNHYAMTFRSTHLYHVVNAVSLDLLKSLSFQEVSQIYEILSENQYSLIPISKTRVMDEIRLKALVNNPVEAV